MTDDEHAERLTDFAARQQRQTVQFVGNLAIVICAILATAQVAWLYWWIG